MSDLEFEYIDLVFENCNGVKIPAAYVECLSLINLRKHKFINFAGQFIEIEDCKDFSVQLKNEALLLKTNWENEGMTCDKSNESFEDHVKKHKDITHVFIKVDKDKEFYIGIPWESDEYNSLNQLQENKFEKDSFTIRCVQK